MIWLFLFVLVSPTLTFKGLTLEVLWQWLNIHPFWAMLLLSAVFRGFYKLEGK